MAYAHGDDGLGRVGSADPALVSARVVWDSDDLATPALVNFTGLHGDRSLRWAANQGRLPHTSVFPLSAGHQQPTR